MFHIFAVCPVYTNIRQSLFGELDGDFTTGQFWTNMLISSDKSKLKDLSNFIVKVLRIRSVYTSYSG